LYERFDDLADSKITMPFGVWRERPKAIGRALPPRAAMETSCWV
jgi:hypothetical protein